MLESARNLVLELNTLQQGLNFLVPSQWWNQFLSLNAKIRNCSDLVIPSQHPLDVLIEIGIIKIQPFGQKKHLASLEENAQRVASSVAGQAKQFLLKGQQNHSSKASNCDFSEWSQSKIENLGHYNKILICGQLQESVIQSMLIDTFQWKVVNPSLYRLICQRQCSNRENHNKNQVIGIPIFLEDQQVSGCQNQMNYRLGTQNPADIYFYNALGVKYCAVGVLQNKVTLGKMMKYLYEGMHKMSIEKHYLPLARKRQLFAEYNMKMYYEVGSDDENLEDFGWRSYKNIRSVIPIEHYKYIQLSKNCEDNNESADGDDPQLYKNRNPSKKIKENEIQIRSVAEKIGKKKGFQPTIITNQSMQQQTKIPAFHIGYGVNTYEVDPLVRTYRANQEYHSSTEEETPSFVGQEGVNQHADLMRFLKKDETRIHYPLWRGNQNIPSLTRLAQIKMNDIISLPFSSFQRVVVRTQNSKNVFLSGRCNKLTTNDQGQPIQQQIPEESPQIMAIPQSITKSLEGLASDMLTKKKHKIVDLMLIRQDPYESVKEKLDAQSQTCRNEEIYDLDQVQSREC